MHACMHASNTIAICSIEFLYVRRHPLAKTIVERESVSARHSKYQDTVKDVLHLQRVAEHLSRFLEKKKILLLLHFDQSESPQRNRVDLKTQAGSLRFNSFSWGPGFLSSRWRNKQQIIKTQNTIIPMYKRCMPYHCSILVGCDDFHDIL